MLSFVSVSCVDKIRNSYTCLSTTIELNLGLIANYMRYVCYVNSVVTAKVICRMCCSFLCKFKYLLIIFKLLLRFHLNWLITQINPIFTKNVIIIFILQTILLWWHWSNMFSSNHFLNLLVATWHELEIAVKCPNNYLKYSRLTDAVDENHCSFIEKLLNIYLDTVHSFTTPFSEKKLILVSVLQITFFIKISQII